MKLVGNTFKDTRDFPGFTKEEILQLKDTIAKLNSDKTVQPQFDEFLKQKLPVDLLEFYGTYFAKLKEFWAAYLMKNVSDSEKSPEYFFLDSELLSELKVVSKNLLNLKLNAQNISRFLKINQFLSDFLSKIKPISEDADALCQAVEKSLKKADQPYNDVFSLWLEASKIKDPYFKLGEIPTALKDWDETRQLLTIAEEIHEEAVKKKEKKKKDRSLTIYFRDIYAKYIQNKDSNSNFYANLVYLLYVNKILEETKEEEFVNVLERKDIAEKVKSYFSPVIGALIKDKMKSVAEEIIDLDKQFDLAGDKRGLSLNELLEQNFNLLLPKVTEYYLSGLEKKYHATINNISDTQEINNIADFYSEKIDILASIVERLNEYIPKLENVLKPYEDLTTSLKKTIVTVVAEIWRRKEEYLNYLETIKKERLNDTVRNYINAKINDANELINKYQDETSIIVREEFPQLKQIRQILSDYKQKINDIKKEVHQKFSELKEQEVEVYPLIKLWEENFDRKKQQLNFLLSLLLNKLYKNFKDLIESEDLMFERIAEIKSQEDNSDLLPLNFALSSYLVDKLTEKELSERISEMQARISKLGKEFSLYKSELSKLEETLANKVKSREGITSTTLHCTVCHKQINFAKDKIIKCPFCDSVFHYLCVAFWLSKYNSCPMCNNNFLEPGSGMFEDQEENSGEE